MNTDSSAGERTAVGAPSGERKWFERAAEWLGEREQAEELKSSRAEGAGRDSSENLGMTEGTR